MDKLTLEIINELQRKKEIKNFYNMAVRYGFHRGNPVVKRKKTRSPIS